MKNIRHTYIIAAPIEKVWKALVNPEDIENWGGGPAEMDDKVGTQFKLWGGDIHGTNVEVIPEEKLIQEWYGGDWDEPSRVTFTLTPDEGATRLDLLHENVPAAELESIEEGWKEYYLGSLKEYLEGT